MSLLGFDAIGRLALVQKPPNNTTLTAASGAYSIAGVTIPFGLSLNVVPGVYSITGVETPLTRDFVNWFPIPPPGGPWTIEPAPTIGVSVTRVF